MKNKVKAFAILVLLMACGASNAWDGRDGEERYGHGHHGRGHHEHHHIKRDYSSHWSIFIHGTPHRGVWDYYPPPHRHLYVSPYPSAYPARVVIERPAPVIYVQQQTASETPRIWYYCADAKAYYPYVKQCPAGWQEIAAQPRDMP